MNPSDITYIQALTRRELLYIELGKMQDYLLVMTSRLTSLQVSMKTLGKDLQIPNYDSCSSLLETAKELLSRGNGNIGELRQRFYDRKI